MAEINAGVNKQEIKNPATLSNCYQQLRHSSEASFNQVLRGVSTTSKTKTIGCNSYDMNSISFLNICKSIALKKDKKMLSVFMEMVFWLTIACVDVALLVVHHG